MPSHKPVVLLVVICGLLTGINASADTLWYNGNFDSRNSLSNEISTEIGQSNVYDDFIVPLGQTWTVTAVYSNDLMNFISDSAEWQIRSGVSLNNGGTLIASGTTPDVQTAVGSALDLTEYTVQVSVPNVVLTPGTYWLTVAPADTGSGRSFITTTSGAACVGLPCGNDGNSFWTSADFDENFANPSDALGPGTWDFSMGVIGTVPEPASMTLLGLAILGLLLLPLNQSSRGVDTRVDTPTRGIGREAAINRHID